MQLLTAVPLMVTLADKVPEAEDVTAGWVAFVIFIALILAVAFLGWSMTKQVRKVDAAEDAGLYDPSDREPRPTLNVQDDTARDGTADNGPAQNGAHD